MKKYIFNFIFWFMPFMPLFGQGIQILPKKGLIYLNGNILRAGQISGITPGDSILIPKNSLVLARKGTAFKELKSGLQYGFEDIESQFKSRKGYTQAFASVLSRQGASLSLEEGSAKRGSSRDGLWFFSPVDSVRVIGDSIDFQVGSGQSKLLTDIKVFGRGLADTMILNANQADFLIKSPKAGIYYWSYVLDNQNLKDEFLNLFVVPEKEDRKLLQEAYFDFCNLLDDFSSEMKAFLINEYCLNHKIYYR